MIPSTGIAKTESSSSTELQHKNVPSNPPTLVPIPCSVSPPALSQTSPLALHNSMSRTDGPHQHFSVIQSTGLAANSKPLALLTQPRRESSPSSSPISLTTSPKAISSTASPKLPKLLPSSSPQHLPLSLCSSPKPLSVPSPPRSSLPPSTSPKPFGLTSSVTCPQKSSLKPPRHAVPGSGKPNKRKQLEASLAQINEFRLKQVGQPDNGSFFFLYHVHTSNSQNMYIIFLKMEINVVAPVASEIFHVYFVHFKTNDIRPNHFYSNTFIHTDPLQPKHGSCV